MNQDCCCTPSVVDSAACGCCEGVEALTPLAVANRPGLAALRYRVGTHATFMETMQARLAGDEPRLAGLTTRDAGDFSLALLDAWATVADVLTFYQERIANEGYLRTATERRSLLELAYLVGYKPRPGVASSVYLAYTLDDKGINKDEEIIIPKGARSQSKPTPGAQPQTFETSEPLKARAAWNNLQVRLTQPQTQQSITENNKLYLKGTTTRLEKGMPLLIDFNDENKLKVFWVLNVDIQREFDRTLVKLKPHVETQSNKDEDKKIVGKKSLWGFISRSITTHAVVNHQIDIKSLFSTTTTNAASSLTGGVASITTMKALYPHHASVVTAALKSPKPVGENKIKVYALRLKSPHFASNAPPEQKYSGGELITGEWTLGDCSSLI